MQREGEAMTTEDRIAEKIKAREEQGSVVPFPQTKRHPPLTLLTLMLAQCVSNNIGQADFTDAVLRLGRLKSEPRFRFLNCYPHPQAGVLRITTGGAEDVAAQWQAQGLAQ